MTKALINEADKLGLNSAPYSDMTEGDGFGMISLDAYRELKFELEIGLLILRSFISGRYKNVLEFQKRKEYLQILMVRQHL